jgi:hypothetical protein
LMADYLRLSDDTAGAKNPEDRVSTIVATGLSQQPYDREKYYWRLRDHVAFLRTQGIQHRCVKPRMSRDFLIEFDGLLDASRAQAALSKLTVFPGGERLFGEIENRGDSLFVTLTYPGQISPEHQVLHGKTVVPLAPAVALVALKNGMHRQEGYVHFSAGLAALAPAAGAHVKALHQSIHAFFGSVVPASTSSEHNSPAQRPADAAAQAIAGIAARAVMPPASTTEPARRNASIN